MPKKNILICTPIKEILPKNNSDTLIYPAQLISNSINSLTKKYKFKEPDYIWKNKSLLSKDYLYLNNFYEKSLEKVRKELNKYHRVNFSLKFWRILLGPWLSIFIFVFFERYKSLKKCFENYDINQINCLEFKDHKKFIPEDMEDFLNSVKNDDLWNQNIYQVLINNFFDKKKIKIVSDYKKTISKKKASSELLKENLLKKSILKIFEYMPFNKFYKYFIGSTHLGMIDEFKLSLKLKQLPIYYFRKKIDFGLNINFKDRKKMAKNNNFLSYFEKKLFELIFEMMPVAYIEGFEKLNQIVKKENFPNKPRVIFSSNFLWYDVVTMMYTALNVENGSNLIYGQHGGCYGINKIMFPEKHETSIADQYISWGWGSRNKKINNLGIILNLRKFSKRKNSDKLLIVFRPLIKYFFSMESGNGTEQSQDYILYSQNFFNNLSSKIKKKTILRLHTNDYKNELFKNFDKKENLKLSNSTFVKDCNNSKLIVNTCNSTTYLQLLSLNIPSIVIWNKTNNPIRKEMIKYFNLLNKNNILFYNSKEAAKFINKIWGDDIHKWWFSSKTQHAIKIFTEVFAKKNDNIVTHLKKQIISNEI